MFFGFPDFRHNAWAVEVARSCTYHHGGPSPQRDVGQMTWQPSVPCKDMPAMCEWCHPKTLFEVLLTIVRLRSRRCWWKQRGAECNFSVSHQTSSRSVFSKDRWIMLKLSSRLVNGCTSCNCMQYRMPPELQLWKTCWHTTWMAREVRCNPLVSLRQRSLLKTPRRS